jgi:transketolase
MVYEALKAARTLEDEGVSAKVINCHSVKPMDIRTVVDSALETGAVVTAEEHQVMGGFGSAVAEVLCRHAPVPLRMVGIQDVFGQSGSPEELMDAYGLTSEAIAESVRDVLEAKGR